MSIAIKSLLSKSIFVLPNSTVEHMIRTPFDHGEMSGVGRTIELGRRDVILSLCSRSASQDMVSGAEFFLPIFETEMAIV